jgi:hypothetical protein
VAVVTEEELAELATSSTIWVHGRCLDVSIYDRDWPESYRY